MQKAKLLPKYEAQFKQNKTAWEFFQNLSPYYKKASVWYVMSAKRETTQLKRLHLLINSSNKKEKLPQFISKK